MSPSRSIDLHGRTVPQALRDFVAFYNRCVDEGYRGRIEVIHGYGSAGAGGQIKRALRHHIETHASCFELITFGNGAGNLGVTQVYPKSHLPLPRGI
jgi:DNA-nicking Smr family endonuclease